MRSPPEREAAILACTMSLHVTAIPGDGIGPEVLAAARRVLAATGVAFEWDVQDAGADVARQEGTPLPDRVVASIRRTRLALKGPTATPAGSGFRSINLALRREFDLYAGIRPCVAYGGVPTTHPRMNIVIVRMNLEDLYAGIEYHRSGEATARLRDFIRDTEGSALGADVGVSIKPISASGARRVARAAFEYARANARSKVTAVHKASVMRATDGLFLEAVREVAGEYPDIAFDDRLVDTACAELVRRPADLDVLVLPTLYGDIVSDLGAALVGGLGMAPGANVGDDCAVFEAVHGSAPRHAGRNRANPTALMLSGAMLLRHAGEGEAAARLEAAIARVIAEGRAVTSDLKPRRDPTAAGTAAYADAVAAALGAD